MAINSFSSCNNSLPQTEPQSILYQHAQCLISHAGLHIVLAGAGRFSLVNPLNISVFYLSYRQRKQSLASHSDIFALNTSIMELMNNCSSTLIVCGIFTNNLPLVMGGYILNSMNIVGSMCLHTLTCVEHYLAVVHPITYLGLRKAKGIRLRNFAIGWVWVSSIASTCVLCLPVELFCVVTSSLTALFCITISYCCTSVLRVLIRPGPADRVGGRLQVDKMKLKAFHTIMIILSVLMLRFGGHILISVIYPVNVMGKEKNCFLWFALWSFYLPSDVVLPLLFLQRAGVLPCCKKV